MSATTSGVRRIDALPRLRSPTANRRRQMNGIGNNNKTHGGVRRAAIGRTRTASPLGPRMGSNLSNRRTSSASLSRCHWPRPMTGHQPTLGTSSETSLEGPRGKGAVPNTDGAVKGGYKPTMVSYPLIIK